MIELGRHNAVVNLALRLQEEKRELKVQNQNYVNHIADLERSLTALRAQGTHIESCDTPRTGFRRVGSLWACHCGQKWRLSVYGSMSGNHKMWERIA